MELLTITAARHSDYEEHDKKGNFVRCERSYGSYSRSFGVEVAALAGVPEEVTVRAKKILRSLERSDVNARTQESAEESEEAAAQESGLVRELKELDVNGLTPMQALSILFDWKEKLK